MGGTWASSRLTASTWLFIFCPRNGRHTFLTRPNPQAAALAGIDVTLKEDGLYGDFHFNPKHPLAEDTPLARSPATAPLAERIRRFAQ